jgi:hypothetical protein
MFKKVALITIAIGCLSSFGYSQNTDPADLGKQLFEGSTKFEKGGPSCITCHNVNSDDLIYGGLYSKDLTKVFSRFGAGLTGFLDNPQLGMQSAYGNNSFTDTEKEALVAFFKKVDASAVSEEPGGQMTMLGFGVGGVVVLFIIIYMLWSNRKKESVKKDIFDRQLSAIN